MSVGQKILFLCVITHLLYSIIELMHQEYPKVIWHGLVTVPTTISMFVNFLLGGMYVQVFFETRNDVTESNLSVIYYGWLFFVITYGIT